MALYMSETVGDQDDDDCPTIPTPAEVVRDVETHRSQRLARALEVLRERAVQVIRGQSQHLAAGGLVDIDIDDVGEAVMTIAREIEVKGWKVMVGGMRMRVSMPPVVKG
jgi:hypothetical protein